jgi:hypothetical protein
VDLGLVGEAAFRRGVAVSHRLPMAGRAGGVRGHGRRCGNDIAGRQPMRRIDETYQRIFEHVQESQDRAGQLDC